MIPAFTNSSLYFPISVSSLSLGITPASEFFVALVSAFETRATSDADVRMRVRVVGSHGVPTRRAPERGGRHEPSLEAHALVLRDAGRSLGTQASTDDRSRWRVCRLQRLARHLSSPPQP